MGLKQQGWVGTDRHSADLIGRDPAPRGGRSPRRSALGPGASRGAVRGRPRSYRVWLLVAVLGILLIMLHAGRERAGMPAGPETAAVIPELEPAPDGPPAAAVRNASRVPDTQPVEDAASQPAEKVPANAAESLSLILEPSENGAYFVRGTINRQEVTFLIDTGSSWISIPERLKPGLQLVRGRYVPVSTAGGVVGNYETVIDHLALGPLQFKRVRGVLNPYAPTDLVLLGMSALKELQIIQKGGRLILTQQQPVAPADDAAPGASRYEPLILRRSLRECMGPGQMIDRRTVDCVEGRR